MKILKKYRDEKKWFPIVEEQARAFLAWDYADVDSILEAIENGYTVNTPLAMYKKGDLECLSEETR